MISVAEGLIRFMIRKGKENLYLKKKIIKVKSIHIQKCFCGDLKLYKKLKTFLYAFLYLKIFNYGKL